MTFYENTSSYTCGLNEQGTTFQHHYSEQFFTLCKHTNIGVRGGGSDRPPRLEKFQGKLGFQGKRKLIKNPD